MTGDKRDAQFRIRRPVTSVRNLARLTRAREPSRSVISYQVLAQALDSETGIDGFDLQKELGGD